MPTRQLVLAALLALTTLATATAATGGSRTADDASAARRTIASTTTSDFRVVVRAEKLSGGRAPAASATLLVYARERGRWERSGSRTLSGPYFWKTLTGPRAVCRLEIRTTGGGPRFRPRALVQLLQTPSLGCGAISEQLLTAD